MDVKEAYDEWAEQYDTNKNRTRDLEGIALQETLGNFSFRNCLEIGCGTGKNTSRLLNIAETVTAVDFSEKMLDKAREKLKRKNLTFIKADVTQDWAFVEGTYDLITFSLILEHMEDLQPVFKKAADVLDTNGILYVGELHPFKQYTGTAARFYTGEGKQVVNCYDHHISDFTGAAGEVGLDLIDLGEYFDGKERTGIPRILCLLFRKNVRTQSRGRLKETNNRE